MKIFLMVVVALWLGVAATGGAHFYLYKASVILRAADGVVVHGFEYGRGRSTWERRPVILLFHQAGSSAAEYDRYVSSPLTWLADCLAIDQRAGGDMYGPNLTMAGLRKPATYLDAIPDLEAALRWAQHSHPGRPIVLWGSSYSASLVFLVAAKHPNEIAAVVAFSPGEYFDDKTLVQRAAAKVRIPIFVDSAADPEEIAAARSILAASPSKHKIQYVPKNGIHGSSTLRGDRDPKGYDENWNAVNAFLKSVIPK